MAKDSLQSILIGSVATAATAAVLALFAKVYTGGEEQAAMRTQLLALTERVNKLDELLDHERLESARTRAMCERWGAKIKALTQPE